MKSTKHLKAKISSLIICLFCASFIIAPNVFAASFTWTDVTSSGSMHNLSWNSITSSSTGQYLAAVAYDGDIYTANEIVPAANNVSTISTTKSISPPNTGYGTPKRIDPAIIPLVSLGIVSISIGFNLIYKRIKVSNKSV